jgi:prophage tail gpP-like protein
MAEDLPEVIVTPETDTPGSDAAPEGKASEGNSTGGEGRDTPQGGTNRSTKAFFRPPYLMRAVVVINGEEYFEWESVYVRIEWYGKPPRQCRLTCSEQTPWAQDWAFLRIRPGDKCEVYLDGMLVITGQVATRQVYYDATQHSVEIQSVGNTDVLGRGTVISPTGEWNNKSLVEIAKSAIAPYGIKLKTLGTIDGSKIPRANSQPGETVAEFVEKYARAKNALTGESNDGSYLIRGMINDSGMPAVVEGKNILIGREVIHNRQIAAGGNFPQAGGGSGGGQPYTSSGQRPGKDDDWGAKPTHGTYSQGGSPAQFSSQFLPKLMMSEIPAWSKAMLENRVRIEKNVDDSNQIFVTVVCVGWQRPNGGLWDPGELVYVDSPMLIMQRPLMLKAVTFSQDNQSGTRSTLELVNAAAMNGGNYPQAEGTSDQGTNV